MRKIFCLFLFSVLLFTGCNSQNRSMIKIELYNPDGDSLGTAKLSEQKEAVKIKLSLTGFEPGLHGIHIHEFPKCEGPDFISAGSHFNPDGKEHGAMITGGPHVGDMPNVEADEDGKVETEVTIQGATLLDGKKSLLRNEGTSIVIHEGKDDGMTQPAGNSGARVACGIITLEEAAKKNPPSDPTESGTEEEE